MSVWSTPVLNNLFANLRKIVDSLRCLVASSTPASAESATATNSVVLSGSIDDNETVGTVFDPALNIRGIEVLSETGATLEVRIEKADGSNLTFRFFSGTPWSYISSMKEAAIVSVTVEHINGTPGAIDTIVNAWSIA